MESWRRFGAVGPARPSTGRPLVALLAVPGFAALAAPPRWALLLGAGLVLLLGLFWLWWRYRQRRAERQAGLVAAGFCSPEPAAAAAPSRAVVEQLIAELGTKATRQPATDSLLRLGDAALARLAEALARETDERRTHHVAQLCARLATPAARQVLVAAAQAPNLPARAAALRALAAFAPEPADAPAFQRLVGEEMQLAQHLLHGIAAADDELRAALGYELRKGRQRLFGLLLQLYERRPVLEAQRGLAHPAPERQDAALAALENLVPRPLYRALEALVGLGRLAGQVQAFDDLLAPPISPEAIQTTVVRRGQAAFSAWTIGVALRQWRPQPATVAYLYPHLQAADPLIQESASAVLRRLPVQRPAAYDHLLTLYPLANPPLMNAPSPAGRVSAQQRVLLLKGTALFADIPENVLASLVPIMKEIAFQPEQEIFGKGALGTSLFIIGEGEVGIFNGPQQLATFGNGDFFGELALLDAEPRSATAVAHGPVVVFRLDQEDFFEVLEEHSEVLRNILRVLCQRLRRQNERALPQ